MYFVYQIHTLTLFFPLVEIIRPRRTLSYLLIGITFLLLPTFFYSYFYSAIEIDPFLAVLAGTSIVYTLEVKKIGIVCDNSDTYSIYGIYHWGVDNTSV